MNNTTQKESLVNTTTHTYGTQKKPTIGDRTDRAWFSRLVQHPARKRSVSILTTSEPARDNQIQDLTIVKNTQLCYTIQHEAVLIIFTLTTSHANHQAHVVYWRGDGHISGKTPDNKLPVAKFPDNTNLCQFSHTTLHSRTG